MIFSKNILAQRIRPILQEGFLLLVLTLLFFVWIGTRYLNLDFSYDELFTFDGFVFAPLITTLTNYGAPNNHIFSSLLHKFYLALIGIPDLFTLMDAPYKIRLLDLGVSLITMGYVYAIGNQFFNRMIGRVALLMLVTTAPFYNFAVLIRGYSLSMMFASVIIYHVWAFERAGKRRDAIAVVLAATLSLYTIPLNIYFLASLVLFYGVRTIVRTIVRRRALRPLERGWAIVGLLCLGIAIAVLIYLPLYRNFMNNRHFKSYGLFYVNTLTQMLPQSFRYFLSERYLFVPILLVALSVWIRPAMRKISPSLDDKLACCATVVCLPFVFSFIRGDHPPSRAFVNLTPVFALWLALSCAVFERWLKTRRARQIALIGLMIYCYGTFAATTHYITQELKADITRNRNRYDMYYNYFQAYYRPMKTVTDFLRNYADQPIPLTLVFNLEEYEMRRYFDKFQVPYYQHPTEVLFNEEGQAYVAVVFAQKFTGVLTQMLPDVRCTVLNQDFNYHKILLCESAYVKESLPSAP